MKCAILLGQAWFIEELVLFVRFCLFGTPLTLCCLGNKESLLLLKTRSWYINELIFATDTTDAPDTTPPVISDCPHWVVGKVIPGRNEELATWIESMYVLSVPRKAIVVGCFRYCLIMFLMLPNLTKNG